jgi:predicted transcriptional regulator
MGYQHINNLYKDNRIFEFDVCYVMEKIHGTSAHIRYSKTHAESTNPNSHELTFFSGGEKHENFVNLFDVSALQTAIASFGQDDVVIYGECYGGKQQGMRKTYGDDLRFVAFDVKMNGKWLDVRTAHTMVNYLKLDFVDYKVVPCKMAAFDAERTAPSAQAKKNGILEDKMREGIVLRPMKELYDEEGERIITKYKNPEFTETRTIRVPDPDNKERLKLLAKANEIAEEWVTEERLRHVLNAAQSIVNNLEGIEKKDLGLSDILGIIHMMQEDIKREAKGEVVESKEASSAIARKTAVMFKKLLNSKIQE